MRAVFRRFGVILAVLGGIASVVVAASAGPAGAAVLPRPAAAPAAAAACTGPRIVDLVGTKGVEGTSPQGVLTPFTFTVVSSGCPLPGAIGFTTVPFTAGRDDVVMKQGVVEFRAGDLSQLPITVLVIPDSQPEPNECFAVLVTPQSSTVQIKTNEAAGIVVDDDQQKPGSSTKPPVTREFHCSE
jgi:hypothetical protein